MLGRVKRGECTIEIPQLGSKFLRAQKIPGSRKVKSDTEERVSMFSRINTENILINDVRILKLHARHYELCIFTVRNACNDASLKL